MTNVSHNVKLHVGVCVCTYIHMRMYNVETSAYLCDSKQDQSTRDISWVSMESGEAWNRGDVFSKRGMDIFSLFTNRNKTLLFINTIVYRDDPKELWQA